jgi:hypothetical protein
MLDHLLTDEVRRKLKDMAGIDETDIEFIKELIDPKWAIGEGAEWRFKGRPMEKSFLYEIVSNKRTGDWYSICALISTMDQCLQASTWTRWTTSSVTRVISTLNRISTCSASS